MPPRQRTFAIMGTRAVGKSSITVQFVDNHFVDSYNPTIENTFQKRIRFRGNEYDIRIVDTAGADDQDIFQDTYAVGIHAYALVFSVASRSSFETTQNLNMKILNANSANKVPRILVGNKSDLRLERQISEDEGKQLAQKWGCPYIECSAKHNENIAELFTKLLQEVEKDLAPPRQQQQEGGCVLM
uniref:Uncharacterized protein n=1 Tax=Vannella robusta TaxID=1487602 RepID=A0A7S4IRV3_9EUKA